MTCRGWVALVFALAFVQGARAQPAACPAACPAARTVIQIPGGANDQERRFWRDQFVYYVTHDADVALHP